MSTTGSNKKSSTTSVPPTTQNGAPKSVDSQLEDPPTSGNSGDSGTGHLQSQIDPNGVRVR